MEINISDLPAGTQAAWAAKTLHFNFDARTSRGAMRVKDTFYVLLTAPDGRRAIGEVPLFHGLSAEDTPRFADVLAAACADPAATLATPPCSSVAFGFESAAAALAGMSPSAWSGGVKGLPINGLVWMADKATMRRQLEAKIAAGFGVVKLKIGGIDFDDELELVRGIRSAFGADVLEVRLDANGSFGTYDTAMRRLDRLAPYGIHSLEQPLPAGRTADTARVCASSPVPIALDEELIGMRSFEDKRQLLSDIRPQYIILKPALCGGFRAADEYISIVEDGRWWATSALESNVGLYAIGRWLESHNPSMPQGLGTGALYTDNVGGNARMEAGCLYGDGFAPEAAIDLLEWNG